MANPSKGGDAKLQGLKWQPATERCFFVILRKEPGETERCLTLRGDNLNATTANPSKGGDAKLQGLKWQPATERGLQMRNGFRKSAFLLSVLLLCSVLMPVTALAEKSCFDLSKIEKGYISVFYKTNSGKSLKIGIKDDLTQQNKFYDYVQGTAESFPLPSSATTVTASLYENVGGSSYRRVQNISFSVKPSQTIASKIPTASADTDGGTTKNLPSSATRYLGSVNEISFRSGDSVSQKAAELVAGKRTTEAQAMAIYSYIVKNFSYDWDLYYDVIYGRVTRYTPKPNSILASKEGICYDIASLYAAMCRSVGIPTKMIKGNSRPAGGYHAWNSVYDDATGNWVSMDLTLDMSYRRGGSSSWRSIGSGYAASSSV